MDQEKSLAFRLNKKTRRFFRALTALLYLLDGLQHGPASVPGLGGLPYAVQTGHAVPLPVLQLPVEGVGEHQDAVIQVQVGHLRERERKEGEMGNRKKN